jgi:hypothetical protein
MIKLEDRFLGAVIPTSISTKKEFANIVNNSLDQAGHRHIYRFGRAEEKYSISHANS